MELHSYAKHRTVKKWSLEQKRRLVEARIHCDDIFKTKPKTSILPWKKVIFQAKLDDFNAVFVRKQWANMVAKYMQYKQDRLGNKPTYDIDVETVKKITQEWEFFQPIHRYMTRKTTNLHSYALTTQYDAGTTEHGDKSPNFLSSPRPERLQEQPPTSTSSNERLNICSSDTYEDYTMITLPSTSLPNTDHDFYSKRAELQQNYFADVEEDTLESKPTEIVNGVEILHTQELIVNSSQIYEPKSPHAEHLDNEQVVQHADIKQEPPETEEIVATTSQSNTQNKANRKKRKLSERDKYYRHKRRFNHRMERRFDAMLNVIGQIAKAEYPSIDTTPLIEIGSSLIRKVLSSDEDDTNDDASCDGDGCS